MHADQYRYRRTWLGRRVLQVSTSRATYLPLIGARVHEEIWRDATEAERQAYERDAAPNAPQIPAKPTDTGEPT
jgi:hypothetical protein